VRKLAITISGAVSLGSYEAGVMYEVFQALKAHNTACDQAGLADEKIWVDVMTGASAGGMSAAIAAQKLLYQAGQLEGADANALYLPWVKEISLQKLLADNASPNKGRSVLCSDVVDQITSKYLLGRYGSAGSVPPAVAHPAAANVIHLGLAMSNMDGVDYAIPLSNNGEFIYTRFADELVRDVSGDTCDTLDFWKEMQSAILACGAFPFAFRPREVLRKQDEYTRQNVLKTSLPPDPLHFGYVDGGLFQNEPLGLAKNLVDRAEAADPSAAANDDRTYLYIAPSIRQSEADFSFRADGADYLALTMRLVTSIFNQSRFQDWIDAEKLNGKILNTHRATGQAFEEALTTGKMNIDKLHSVSEALAPQEHKAFAAGTGPTGLLKAKRHGLESDYRRLSSDPNVGGAGADAWINAVAAARGALGTLDFMRVDTIIAKPSELSGGALEAFAGFFDESYRQHDYDMGRVKAQQVLTGGNCYLGALRGYAPAPVVPPPAPDPKIDPSKLDQSLRVRFRDRLRSGIKDLLSQSGKTNAIERWIADVFIVKGMLNSWLQL
jgi:predicted acylesterase/phospholipase RssA